MSRIKRIILLAVPAILLPLVFAFDAARTAVDFNLTTLTFLREIAVLISFALFGFFVENRRRPISRNARKEIGRLPGGPKCGNGGIRVR